MIDTENGIMKNIRKLWNTHIDLQYSLMSMALILPKYNHVRIPDETGKDLFLLMNGPSLTETIEKYGDKLASKCLMCVNLMACTDWYEQLKPKFYTIADVKFWQKMDGVENNELLKKEQAEWDSIIDNVTKKTKWKMYFFLPSLAKRNDELVKALEENSYITPVYLNSGYEFQGFDSLHYKCWEKQLCVPNLENVLVLSLYAGILMKFSNLYLLGCDHTFFSGFSVDNNNQFMYEYKHSYDNDSTYKVPYDSYGKKYTVGKVLDEYAALWKTYSMLREFSEIMGVSVYNCTEPSLIDTFERKNITEVL